MLYKFQFTKLSMAAMCLAMLQGCGANIDCNDSKTKKTVIEIIQSHLVNAVWYKEASAFALSAPEDLQNIKTLSRDENVKQSTCTGQYSVTYNGKPRKFEAYYEVTYFEDKGEAEVTANVNDVKSGLLGMIAMERPNPSPEDLAKKKQLYIEDLKAKIQYWEQQVVNDSARNRVMDAFKVEVVSFNPGPEMVLDVTNNTEYTITAFGYEVELSNSVEGGAYQGFKNPLQPGESVHLVIGASLGASLPDRVLGYNRDVLLTRLKINSISTMSGDSFMRQDNPEAAIQTLETFKGELAKAEL